MYSMCAYRSGGRALQFIRRHRGDGGAPSALVRNPVQRVFGCVLTVAPQAAPATQGKRSNEQRSSPNTLRKPNGHHRTHNSPPTVPILSQINSSHDVTTNLSSTSGLPSSPFSSGPPPHQNPLCLSLLPHTCHTPNPSHRS